VGKKKNEKTSSAAALASFDGIVFLATPLRTGTSSIYFPYLEVVAVEVVPPL